MSKEYFWGDSLTSSKKEIKWNPTLEDEEDFDNLDSDGIQHFLFLKQAVLGVKAKEGERNVVEIETENFDGDDVKQPLFSLKLGLNESCPLDIGVQPPVTFTLTAGAGPVYLSGQHMIEINAEDDDDEEEEEEDNDLDIKASPDLPPAKTKKRPLSTSEAGAKQTKMAKLDKEADKKDKDEQEEEDVEMPEMDDDDDDEDDEDFEGGEEEEDEEDSDEEDDDDHEDDDDEEEEEEEDEETPEKPVKKVKGKKSQMNGTATAKGDSKAKVTAIVKPVKGRGKKKAMNLDEIKEKISETPNVPKKEEKFKNYIRSTFHITDPKKLQDLVNWHRASSQK